MTVRTAIGMTSLMVGEFWLGVAGSAPLYTSREAAELVTLVQSEPLTRHSDIKTSIKMAAGGRWQKKKRQNFLFNSILVFFHDALCLMVRLFQRISCLKIIIVFDNFVTIFLKFDYYVIKF